MSPGDQRLLRRLGGVLDQVDPPPAESFEAARAALSMRDLDGELIPLIEQAELTAVRGPSHHAFSFAVDGVEIELAASRGRFGWALVGQLVTTSVADSITVRTLTSRDTVPLDELGRFQAEVPAGPVMLRLLIAEDRVLRTDWVSL